MSDKFPMIFCERIRFVKMIINNEMFGRLDSTRNCDSLFTVFVRRTTFVAALRLLERVKKRKHGLLCSTRSKQTGAGRSTLGLHRQWAREGQLGDIYYVKHETSTAITDDFSKPLYFNLMTWFFLVVGWYYDRECFLNVDLFIYFCYFSAKAQGKAPKKAEKTQRFSRRVEQRERGFGGFDVERRVLELEPRACP